MRQASNNNDWPLDRHNLLSYDMQSCLLAKSVRHGTTQSLSFFVIAHSLSYIHTLSYSFKLVIVVSVEESDRAIETSTKSL